MNVKTRWGIRIWGLNVASIPMSLTGLWIVYICILQRKFMAYGIGMYGLRWNVPASIWMEIKMFFHHSIWPMLPLLLGAIVFDGWLWLYLFRKEQQ